MGTLRTLLITIMALFGVAMSQPAEAGKGRETAHYCFASEGRGFCLELVATENEVVGSDTLTDRLENAAKKAYPNSTELLTANWSDALRLGIMEQSGELSVAGMERKSTQTVLRDIFAALHPQTASPSTPALTATPAESSAAPNNDQSAVAPIVEPPAPTQVVAATQPEPLFTKAELEAARSAGHDEGRKEAEDAASSKLAELTTQNVALKQERDKYLWLLRSERKNSAAMSAAHDQTKVTLSETKKELGEAAAALALIQGKLASTQQVADACHGDLAGTRNVNANLSGTLKNTRVLGGVGLFAMLGIGVAVGRISANRRQKGDSTAIEPRDVGGILHGISAAKEVPLPPTAREPIPQPKQAEPAKAKPSRASQALEALDASGYLAKEAEKTNLSTGGSTTETDEVLEVVEEPEPPTVRLSGEATLSGDPTRDTAQYSAATIEFAGLAGEFLEALNKDNWSTSQDIQKSAREICARIANGHQDDGATLHDVHMQARALLASLDDIIKGRDGIDCSPGRIRNLIGQVRMLCEPIVRGINLGAAGKRAAS